MEKQLNELNINESGVVKKVLATGKIKRRLFDMGVTPNTKITVKKFAPLKDPIEVEIRGYSLTLRIDEAKQILMEV